MASSRLAPRLTWTKQPTNFYQRLIWIFFLVLVLFEFVCLESVKTNEEKDVESDRFLATLK